MGIQVPEEYGGAGMTAIDYCICIEEVARVCPSVALSLAAHNGLSVAHINRCATDEQRRRFLPPLARGDRLGAWALTEASSGSDASSMRTTATLRDGLWVLNGSKVFTTHGRVGSVIVVMAVTNRALGPKGISAFIVEKGTARSVRRKEREQTGNARE